ncbi:hypothetical protein [Fluviicola sp.]|uniref:hypothetical protein n=1 Tax=Fluviicola sp. TaxID=1917219 RepID=UPI002626BBBF|nr:hypothetical protein [Fluviicola sp.]
MNSIFLRAKHWQIFVSLMVIPFIVMIIFSIIIAVVLVSRNPQKPEEIAWIFYFMPFIIAASSFVQFAWLWNVATQLSKLVPRDIVKLPLGRIKTFIILPIFYLCCIPLFIAPIIGDIGNFDHGPNPGMIIKFASLGIVFFFLHLFCMFCLFHTFYFVAKTIRAAELQRHVTFSDFTGDFFLVWFLPIGVWFLQPRINNLVKAQNEISGLNSDDIIDKYSGH